MIIDDILNELKPLLNNNKKEVFDKLVSTRLTNSLENYADELLEKIEESEFLLATDEGTKKLLYKINKKEKVV